MHDTLGLPQRDGVSWLMLAKTHLVHEWSKHQSLHLLIFVLPEGPRSFCEEVVFSHACVGIATRNGLRQQYDVNG